MLCRYLDAVRVAEFCGFNETELAVGTRTTQKDLPRTDRAPKTRDWIGVLFAKGLPTELRAFGGKHADNDKRFISTASARAMRLIP